MRLDLVLVARYWAVSLVRHVLEARWVLVNKIGARSRRLRRMEVAVGHGVVGAAVVLVMVAMVVVRVRDLMNGNGGGWRGNRTMRNRRGERRGRVG